MRVYLAILFKAAFSLYAEEFHERFITRFGVILNKYIITFSLSVRFH